jgi:hypothetical protein
VDAHPSLHGAARVTGSRSRIVAAQAVVVVLLVVVVFATLLQPEGSNPLFGITTPGGPSAAGLPTPGSYDDPDHRDGEGRETRPGTIRSGAGGPPAAGASPSAPVGGGLIPAPEAGADGDGEPSPTDDQYADTLTRLAARLN